MKLSRLVSFGFMSSGSLFLSLNTQARTPDPENTEYARQFVRPFEQSDLNLFPNPKGARPNSNLEDAGFKPLDNPRLTNVLDSIFAHSKGSNTVWSVDIRAFSPKGLSYSIYQFNPRTDVRPASNMKLLTTWTAFHNIPELSKTDSNVYSKVYDMMKTSDNDAAETVLDWSGGPKAVFNAFTQENLEHTPNMRIVDGSGLSYSNRVATSDLMQVLLSVYYSSYYHKFRALLPIAGVDGTLASRRITSHASISAKTGTLTDDPDVALSGYADVDGGWQVIFSIVGDSVPDLGTGRSAIDRALDEVANTMRFYK